MIEVDSFGEAMVSLLKSNDPPRISFPGGYASYINASEPMFEVMHTLGTIFFSTAFKVEGSVDSSEPFLFINYHRNILGEEHKGKGYGTKFLESIESDLRYVGIKLSRTVRLQFTSVSDQPDTTAFLLKHMYSYVSNGEALEKQLYLES